MPCIWQQSCWTSSILALTWSRCLCEDTGTRFCCRLSQFLNTNSQANKQEGDSEYYSLLVKPSFALRAKKRMFGRKNETIRHTHRQEERKRWGRTECVRAVIWRQDYPQMMDREAFIALNVSATCMILQQVKSMTVTDHGATVSMHFLYWNQWNVYSFCSGLHSDAMPLRPL